MTDLWAWLEWDGRACDLLHGLDETGIVWVLSDVDGPISAEMQSPSKKCSLLRFFMSKMCPLFILSFFSYDFDFCPFPSLGELSSDFHSLTEHLKNLQILNITLFISWHLTREIT